MDNDNTGFWEAAFTDKQEMWGLGPAASAVGTAGFFAQQGIRQVLIPGFGYGRNAQAFREQGMTVTGIEIAPTAIAMARAHFGTEMTVYEGSVTDMPFDDRMYEGIFCYALIHLLDTGARQKLVTDCYHQLAPGGWMVFVAISKAAATYGQGTPAGPDRFLQHGGVHLFFYEEASIRAEFAEAGLVAVSTIEEQHPFFLVRCRKPGSLS